MDLTDDDKIAQIIKSFDDYAFNNIKDNKERPIAAFILCCCFIDQLAAFRYNSDHNGRWEDFIKDYLPDYEGAQLYDTLRNKLVHNYSLDGYYKLAWVDGELEDVPSEKLLNV